MHYVLLGQSVCAFSCCEFIDLHVSVFFYSLHFHSSASRQGNTMNAFNQNGNNGNGHNLIIKLIH